MLALICAREKKYPEALRSLEELRERYPENYLTYLDMAGMEIRRGRPADAVKLLKEVLAKIDARTRSYVRLEPPIVYNQLGVAYRAAGDLTSSETWLRRTLSATSAAPRSKTIANLELGKTLDQMGRRSEAVEQYGQVRKAADYAGSHREAARYLSQPYQPR
jgi:tetratricopeptide (TPR) repeat protein